MPHGAQLVESTPEGLGLDETTRSQFQRDFDKRPFLFQHQLAGHPLFELPRLMDLAASMIAVPSHVHYDTGDIEVRNKWSSVPVQKSLAEALASLETGDTWIILKSAHTDPRYERILKTCISEIIAAVGRPLENKIKTTILSIILSSPRRVTPYHMDSECNYLLQFRGSKTIYIFDSNDRSVVTAEELERFWTFDRNAASYRESIQSKAMPFNLTPGTGVHVPLTFPHWVKNGSEVSVSVSMNFDFHQMPMADVHRANHYLRRCGLNPAGPGVRPWADRLKIRMSRGVSLAKRHLHR